MKLTGASYIVRIIELLDADYLFAYPGGAILPIYDALAHTSLNCVLVRHEQAAAFAAQGYARTLPNKPGFCLATSGPGATNLVTGIADAYADSIPMIAITGQVPTHLLGTDAFQETDITGICMPITKKTYLLRNIGDAEEVFRNAYEVAINGRKGPVLIDIPKDVQNAEIELADDWETRFKQPAFKRVYNAHSPMIDKSIDMMVKAKKPLIIAGHGIILADAIEEFRRFVTSENIPTISTVLGIGILDRNNPLYFSWLGMHGMKYANDAVQEADLIIALGIRFDDRITGKLNEFAPNAKVIHVDIDESEASKNVPTNAFIHADLKVLLKCFPSTVTAQNKLNRASWINQLQKNKEKYPLQKADFKVFNMITALDLLNDTADHNTIVSTDVGQHQMWAGQYLTNIGPYNFLTSGGLGSMGFGLPAAMGAQAAQPNKTVWSISGDGSFQMNLQELMTIVQEKWPIKILILDNTYLGMVRQWQEQFYDRNYSGVNLINPNFALMAEAYGIPCVSVDNTEDYKKALKKANGTDGPFLIHAQVLKEDNVYPMVPSGVSLSETIYYPEFKEAEEINEEAKLLENKM